MVRGRVWPSRWDSGSWVPPATNFKGRTNTAAANRLLWAPSDVPPGPAVVPPAASQGHHLQLLRTNSVHALNIRALLASLPSGLLRCGQTAKGYCAADPRPTRTVSVSMNGLRGTVKMLRKVSYNATHGSGPCRPGPWAIRQTLASPSRSAGDAQNSTGIRKAVLETFPPTPKRHPACAVGESEAGNSVFWDNSSRAGNSDRRLRKRFKTHIRKPWTTCWFM